MSLEVYYKPSNSITVKAEGRDLMDVFKILGPVQEVLNNDTCGKCGGKKIRMSHRKTPEGGHDIYEMVCETKQEGRGMACNSKLSLGNKDGTLFPRRYEQEKGSDNKWHKKLDAEGKTVWLPNNGWVRWDTQQKKYV